MVRIFAKIIVPVFFIMGSFFTLSAQKAGGFYDKLYEFNFPVAPLPSKAVYYKTSDDLKTGSIIMKDYRGEMVTIDNFNQKRPTYHPAYKNYPNPLTVLQTPDDLKSNKTNTVFYTLRTSDIELYYKKGEIDSIYDVYADFSAHYDAKFQGKTIAEDSLIFKDKVGEMVSTMSDKDFAIVAVNKSKHVAYDANDEILVKVHNAFQGFIRRAQMYYGKNNVAFFKLRKTKKLSTEDIVISLTEDIRNLHKIDTGFKARNERNAEVQRLIETFNTLLDSEDYKDHDDYKIFVHGNLGSLYSLLEAYKKGMAQYDLANSFKPRIGVGSYLNDGKRKAKIRMLRKENLFVSGENSVKPEFNDNYNKIYHKN